MIDNWREAPGADRSAQAPFGRDAVVAHVVDLAVSSDSAPLVLVTGPIGMGRSSLLSAVRDELAARGFTPLSLRVARNERDRPYSLVSRLSAELAVLHRGGEARRTAKAAAPLAEAGRQLAAELRSALTAGDKLTVLIDDAHWTDPGSRAVLLSLVRTLAGGPVTIVCTVRPSSADPAGDRVALEQLRAASLAEVVPLRPLREREVGALIAWRLQARPTAALLAYLQRECRGRPAAVLAALAGHQRTGGLYVFDRHVYLTSPDRPPELPVDLPPIEYLRRLGGLVWPVAKAAAVLLPLGGAAAGLIAEAVNRGEEEVRGALSELCTEGVLRQGPEEGHWRFRLPLLTSALTGCLGPYERRRLAQLAVTAIWAGQAGADDRYLAEQLVVAGRFVDTQRAAGELLARGTAAMLDDGYSAERWLRAAVELITEPRQRARALIAHAATCCVHLRFTEAVDSARRVLSEHGRRVGSEALFETGMIYVVALAGTLDTAALAEFCDGGWRSLPGGEPHRVLIRCVALCHLDRWREADEHLASQRHVWQRDNDVVAALGLLIGECVGAFLGRTGPFDRAVADPPGWPLWASGTQYRFERLWQLVRTLMAFGELDRADRLLTAYELPSTYRTVPDQVVADSQSGRWDRALDLARMGLATGLSIGYVPSHTLVSRETSVILGARGRLTEARSVIERARSVQPVMLHLLAVPESLLDEALGDVERARRVLAEGLAQAAERGLVVGTDVLWLRTAELELARGDLSAAQRCVAETRGTAELIGTGRARVCHLLATAMVHRDRAAAAEAVRLARRRAQPLELATTMAMAVRHDVAGAELLPEAYALYGDLDALLRRAQLRNLMRERGVAVPHRGVVIAENERLLATLVTEGLTNRELAAVLGGSEKSVESRLGRLFKRTGYRSRVELASAMLTDEYHP
ncbi:AAA family ATPase [Streptomyces ziwulingensis]|uniref:HTH luxR-type domain-containing protein n=1 Tax=Streptomyces ziwulingensis TaxID=1045501 RepID=A0ABP9BA42_9ACTN